jgi:hypothetical protein
MKPILQFAAVGLIGIVAWKMFAFLLLPLVGFIVKLAVLAAAVFFVIWLLRKDKSKDSEAPAS